MDQKRYSILDYFAMRGDLTFEERGINEVDIMMFACLGKPDYGDFIPANGESISFSEAYSKYMATRTEGQKAGLLESQIFNETLIAAAKTARFKDIKISHFLNKVVTADVEQISALTVEGPDGITYVTFRGTDDSIIGWKENCDLAILDETPAQKDAVLYLERIANTYDGPIAVLGHSKGGNLAIYASAHVSAEIQDRIKFIYSYDGPGFRKEFLDSEAYLRIKSKIITYVPYASIVGMIMSPAGKINVIACEEEGPYAHDVYLWNLTKDGFVHLNDLSDKSKIFHVAMNNTLNSMDMQERRDFTDDLFEALMSTGSFNLLDFSENSFKKALIVANNFSKSKEIKSFIMSLAENSLKLSFWEKFEEEFNKQQ